MEEFICAEGKHRFAKETLIEVLNLASAVLTKSYRILEGVDDSRIEPECAEDEKAPRTLAAMYNATYRNLSQASAILDTISEELIIK